MSMTELRKALDAREISAEELAKQYLGKIARLDDAIGACPFVDEALALAMARKAQKRIDAGEAALLTGIPIGLKDNLCTRDMPTTCASKMLAGYRPPYDATVVERLREQNAVLIAKLNMDEFAMGSANMNSAYRITRNPYDLSKVPGGSSGAPAHRPAADLRAGPALWMRRLRLLPRPGGADCTFRGGLRDPPRRHRRA